jgi:hypothetical protein
MSSMALTFLIDSMYFCLINSSICWHFIVHMKGFCFPHELYVERHNECISKNKTMIKLKHIVKDLYMLWISGINMLTMAWIFLGSNSLPSLNTINSKIIIRKIMETHF